MRLIDADELTYLTLGEDTETPLEFVPTEFIEKAETIEAIPIQWIKDYAHSMEDKRLSGTADNIYTMLREWRMSHGLYKRNR